MTKKEAVYVLVGLLAVTTAWFLIVERAIEENPDDEDCGCNG